MKLPAVLVFMSILRVLPIMTASQTRNCGKLIRLLACHARVRTMARAVRASTVILMAAFISPVANAADASEKFHIDIPAGPASESLHELARATRLQILFESDVVASHVTRAVSGDLLVTDALALMMQDSGLDYHVTNSNTISVVSSMHVPETRTPSHAAGNESAPTNTSKDGGGSTSHEYSTEQSVQNHSERLEDNLGRQKDIGEVVITGTHIRGSQDTAAPTLVISREDIGRTGYSSLQDVFRALPQNLGEISGAATFGDNLSAIAGSNAQQVEGISLRGLGPEATLVLLNGQRRPGNENGRIVDISAIPLSVIERVEVVTGGASAVYGSDAVAGVVNLVTRSDFDGAESQVYYGAPSHPGGGRFQLSQMFGKRFNRGGFVIAYDYANNQPFDATRAGVTISPSNLGLFPQTIQVQPDSNRQSGFFSGHFDPTDRVALHGDALYTKKNTSTIDAYGIPDVFAFSNEAATSSEQFSASAGMTSRLSDSWTLDVSGETGAVTNLESTLIDVSTSPALDTQHTRAALSSASVVLNGGLFSIGNAAETRGAVGAEWRYESYTGEDAAVLNNNERRSRSVYSAFAEISAPLLKESDSIGMRRLDLSAAVRYDHYSDFGSTTNPEVGLIWSPAEGTTLRGTYSTAFRAPDLYSLAAPSTAAIFDLPDPKSPEGTSPVLVWGGGNSRLEAETAHAWTLDLTFVPSFSPHTKISTSYFNISYRSRIDQTNPALTDTLQNEQVYAAFVNRTPSQAQIAAIVNNAVNGVVNTTSTPFDPGSQTVLGAFPNIVLLDDRFNNVGIEHVQGLDLEIKGAADVAAANILYGLNGTYYLRFNQQITAFAQAISNLNQPARPARFRLRGSTGVAQGPVGIYAYLNYVNSYVDTLSIPPGKIASWTTVDVSAQLDASKLGQSEILSGLTATLTAENIFARDPPAFAGSSIGTGFDPTNSNAFGRILSVRVVKNW